MQRLAVSLVAATLLLSASCASPTPEPTLTAEPAPTVAPAPALDLESVLFAEGDLPSIYEAGPIGYSIPMRFGDVPEPEFVITMELQAGSFKAEPGIAIFLYPDPAELEAAFAAAVEFQELTERAPTFGEREAYAQSQLVTNSARLLFTKCEALIYVHLFSPEADEASLMEYARCVSERADPLVCP